MQANLAGKVAIVTGAARGIGRAYALGLAGAGAAVLVADLREDLGRDTAKAIEADGGRAVFQTVDVADPDSTAAMAATAASELGGIDVLVNNAAMFASLRGGPFTDIEVDRWDRTMAVNVRGPWLCARAVVPHMRARGGGSIVNQSSIAALGLGGMLDYATSKAALIGFTKNLALELGRDHIRVNAIAPGGVATEANAEITGDDPGFSALAQRAKVNQSIGDPIQPGDLVETMLYLAGDASRFMTGQTLVVDGGRFFLG
jgi:NAD(P)-dependent dehydrogenase (short-subunit alcohol dehydrogenase family)